MANPISPLQSIPELQAMNKRSSLIRIPDQIDVPVTPRVTRLIDSAGFRRLAGISQLGLVSLVYPGATHNRFEHSLGVFRNALLFINQLSQFDRFSAAVTPKQITALIVASLLHDIGHWPYCHPIEDIGLDIPDHESVAASYIAEGEIAELLKQDWGLQPKSVLDIISKTKKSKADRLLSSILTGPIDIDKMDYLYRDSLHCGVPYGKNFDSGRLINSLCLNQNVDGIAITSKGKTAAEMMVFARYVMFSEVYWHHTVRSATAMFQRAFYLWHQRQTAEHRNQFLLMNEAESIASLRADRSNPIQLELLEGLFGLKRNLYKRVCSFSFANEPTIYSRLAQQPYSKLVEMGRTLADQISQTIGQTVSENHVIIDAPPVGPEVQFEVDLFDATTEEYKSLKNLSPVVNALATRQFDDFVKQVRVFIHPKFLAKADKNTRRKLAQTVHQCCQRL